MADKKSNRKRIEDYKKTPQHRADLKKSAAKKAAAKKRSDAKKSPQGRANQGKTKMMLTHNSQAKKKK